jgi:hypothetical protein
MGFKKYKAKYNIGDILSDGRKIINIERVSEREYRFLLYCDSCKTEKWVKRHYGLHIKCVGCGGKIWRHETEEDKIASKSFTNYRYQAKKRGYEFTLTRTEFLNIISMPCYWCGSHGKIGVDRKNNTLGYTLENSVPSCKRCNYAKNDMSIDEWTDWIRSIAQHQLTR